MLRALGCSAVGIALLSTTVMARYIIWKANNRPPVSLQSALEIASADLKDDNYYCIGARLASTNTQGDWELEFSNKEGKQRWYSIGSDKSILKSDDGFSY